MAYEKVQKKIQPDSFVLMIDALPELVEILQRDFKKRRQKDLANRLRARTTRFQRLLAIFFPSQVPSKPLSLDHVPETKPALYSPLNKNLPKGLAMWISRASFLKVEESKATPTARTARTPVIVSVSCRT